nr:hypothetical protein [Tanacetum cinerariifolium]
MYVNYSKHVVSLGKYVINFKLGVRTSRLRAKYRSLALPGNLPTLLGNVTPMLALYDDRKYVFLGTLCKQGDWFSFAKRHAPSPICIDDNRSCMKHWKSGLFLIDWRVIPTFMVLRHPSAMINDPRRAAGSFSMDDVSRLSAYVIKLRDMPEGVLVLSRLSHVWKIRICDPVLQGVDGNVMGIHDFRCLPERTGAEVQGEPHHDI